MPKVDYKSLFTTGKIETLSDLIRIFRKEVIETYNSKSNWPDYQPTEKGKEELGRIYLSLNLALEVPFSAFVQIINERTTTSQEGFPPG